MVSSPGDSCRPAPPDLLVDDYTLARLSEVDDEDVWTVFDNACRLGEVPSIVPMGDGSYEIVILTSHHNTLPNRLNARLPLSEFEFEDCNPVRPTDADLETWDDESAKTLRKQWFFLKGYSHGFVEAGLP